MSTAIRILRKWKGKAGTRANARNVKTVLQALEKDAGALAAAEAKRWAGTGGDDNNNNNNNNTYDTGSTTPTAPTADAPDAATATPAEPRPPPSAGGGDEEIEGQRFMLRYAWGLFRWWVERAAAPTAPGAPAAYTFNDTDHLELDAGFMKYVDFVERSLDAVNSIELNVFPLRHVLRAHADELRGGMWLEFGVASGKSLRIMAALAGAGQRIVGFDSFLGLPCKWREGFEEGRFSTGGVPPDVLTAVATEQQGGGGNTGDAVSAGKPDLEFVKGWFDDTAEPFFAGVRGQRIALVHIDCDVYSSTKTVLDAIGRHHSIGAGCLFVFDELVNYGEFERHEMKALYEFCEEFGYTVQWLGVERKGCLPAACRVTKKAARRAEDDGEPGDAPQQKRARTE